MGDMTTDEARLHELLMEYADRASADDLEGWLSLWCEDGVQMPANAPARVGISAIRNAMAPVFAELRLSVEIRDVWATRIDAETGYTHCDYSISAVAAGNGDEVDVMRDGKALTIFRRQANGAWRIAYDCVNSNVE
ncbi:MAG: DUF4440 domain-containing protein [Pseudomonadota bacterium]